MSFCVWITGLPGSGKSTIAAALGSELDREGVPHVILNLDQLRKTLTPEPQYTEEERDIVYRSLVVMGRLLVVHSEKNVIIDATGNRRRFRDLGRQLIPDFAEIYVHCPLAVCMERERGRKGTIVREALYEKAASGELDGEMPGISVPYERTENPDLQVDSQHLSPAEAAGEIMNYIRRRWPEHTPPLSPRENRKGT